MSVVGSDTGTGPNWSDLDRTDEQRMLRATIREIANSFGHRYYADQARTGGTAAALWEALGRGGFLGLNLPADYGGGGAGISELAIVEEELATAGCPLLMLVVSPTICGSLLSRYGSDTQKATWLPSLASGQSIMSFAITEPNAGSNSHLVETVATRKPSGWSLRGTKHYISGVDVAQAVMVVAKTRHHDGNEHPGLSIFVVETGRAGFDKVPIETELVSPERQFTLFFDDVDLPDEALVGIEGHGLRQVFDGLNPERILAAAVCNGLGRFTLAQASAYARDRQVWSVPIGAHQGIAHPLARAKIQLEAARLMTAHAAARYDEGCEVGPAANMAKYLAADAVLECLDRAIQTHGGHGLSREHGLADLWALARLYRIAPVSQEMVLNFIAQRELRLPKSY